MDELRVLRREENALILANELGEEFRFIVDEAAASEVRQISKRSMGTLSIRPREIQARLRSGKSRAEVAAETGLDEADVERFEEPVRAEQRYMLDLAHAVPVRTERPNDASNPQDEQRFGEVIAERLIGLGTKESTWRSWRDENAGWLIGLVFNTSDGEHDAIWGFDHRKRVLNPVSPDATNLSKAGDVGDRLIPKLRAVDNEQRERFDSDAFDPNALLNPGDGLELEPEIAEQQTNLANDAPEGPQSSSVTDTDEEYERRRDIDHLAVNTPASAADDMSETADLLDALRRRRGERAAEQDRDDASSARERTGAAANIWGASGVSAHTEDAQDATRTDSAESEDDGPRLRAVDGSTDNRASTETGNHQAGESQPGDSASSPENGAQRGNKASKRGRSSIPSWDDILFGTRSDDDPA
ncbi:MAG: septation protein SepH [Leucobacter sp.]